MSAPKVEEPHQAGGILGSQKKRKAEATATRNTSKGGLKKFIPYVLWGAAILSILLWWRSDDTQKMVTEKSVTPSSVAVTPVVPVKPPLPEVVIMDVVILPGITTVVKPLRCEGNNLSDEQLKKVSRVHEGDKLIFTSSLEDPANIRIWFFDAGGDCKSDSVLLKAQRKFI